MEIEGALKRAEAADSTPNRVDPDARVGAASDRVARLEQAIAAMGNFLGPEMDVLVASLKKAQKESQELPLDAQIRAREDFIERAKKRIDHFDLERAAEVRRMEESQKRLAELRALQGAQSAIPPTIDANAEVSRLQQMVVDLQRQFPVAPLVVSPFRSRKREVFDPATEQEVLEWLADRQEDMNRALMSGNPFEAARISWLITDATRSLKPAGVQQPSMVSNVVRSPVDIVALSCVHERWVSMGFGECGWGRRLTQVLRASDGGLSGRGHRKDCGTAMGSRVPLKFTEGPLKLTVIQKTSGHSCGLCFQMMSVITSKMHFHEIRQATGQFSHPHHLC